MNSAITTVTERSQQKYEIWLLFRGSSKLLHSEDTHKYLTLMVAIY